MESRAQGQGPCYIRWQINMSYIIEALKKAQKEKDSHLIHYIGAIKGRSEQKGTLGRKILYFSILILLLILLVFVPYSWLDLSVEKESPKKEHNKTIKIEEPDSDIGVSALYEKAGQLYKDGNFQEAKELYEAALSLDPGYVEALNNLGVIYIREKNYTKAKRIGQVGRSAVLLLQLYHYSTIWYW